MRAFTLLLVILLTTTPGCTLLRKYYTKADHFPYGTAAEEETSKSVLKAAHTMETIFKSKDFTILKSEKTEESATIRASRNNIEYIVDIKGGAQGSIAHMEIEEAGNHTEAWALLKELNLYP